MTVGNLARRWSIALLLPMLLIACSSAKLLDMASSPEDRALAQAAIKDLIDGRADSLSSRMPAQLRPQLATQFRAMRAALPFDAVTDIKLIDARWFGFRSPNGLGYRDAQLVYEIVSGDHRALAQITIRRQGKTALVTGLSVNGIERPAAELTAFRFTDITMDNGVVAALMIAGTAATIAAIRRIWTSGLFRRRWLWIAGSLLGIGRISSAWGAAGVNLTPIYLNLMPFSIIKQGVLQPWQIGATVPIFAIWALLRHRRRKDAIA